MMTEKDKEIVELARQMWKLNDERIKKLKQEEESKR